MNKKRTHTPKHPEVLPDLEGKILLGLAILLIVGVFYSKALISISMGAMVIFAVRYISTSKIMAFFKDQTLMPFTLVFLTVFLSGSHSDDHQEWMTALRVKLPFLVLPFFFFVLPKVKEWTILYLHYWIILICTVVCGSLGIIVISDVDASLDLLAKGQPISSPIEHVKMSMFNAYAAVSGLVILFEQKHAFAKWKKGLLIGTTLFIIILMHVLAVRTGLVILYISLAIYFGSRVLRSGSVIRSLAFGLFLIAIPMISIQLMPTLQQKIAYMKHDWLMHRQGSGAQYSDSERMMSLKAGWDIWKKNPVIGSGYGDVRALTQEYCKEHFVRTDFRKLPHSQYLLTLAGSGLLGLIIFLSGFYTPLLSVRRGSMSSLLFGYLVLNYSLSFLVENSLERSISVGFFLTIALLLIKSIDQNIEKE